MVSSYQSVAAQWPSSPCVFHVMCSARGSPSRWMAWFSAAQLVGPLGAGFVCLGVWLGDGVGRGLGFAAAVCDFLGSVRLVAFLAASARSAFLAGFRVAVGVGSDCSVS